MDPPEKLRITRTGPPSRPPQRGKRASSQPNKKTRGEHRARPVLLLYPRRLSGKHLFASKQTPDTSPACSRRARCPTLYGVPEHPEEDPRKISVASWL